MREQACQMSLTGHLCMEERVSRRGIRSRRRRCGSEDIAEKVESGNKRQQRPFCYCGGEGMNEESDKKSVSVSVERGDDGSEVALPLFLNFIGLGAVTLSARSDRQSQRVLCHFALAARGIVLHPSEQLHMHSDAVEQGLCACFVLCSCGERLDTEP